jgi:hypothetical protein
MSNKKFLFPSVFFLCLISACAVSIQWASAKISRSQRATELVQSPKILKEQGSIVLPEKMKAAIRKFNPNFKTWTSNDYTPLIANEFHPPFALIVDANRDGALDIILDGHDNQTAILIGVVSYKGDYKVISIREGALEDPKTIKNLFGESCDRKEFGLNYYLMATSGDSIRDGARVIFEVHFPQQCDEGSNLGGISEYGYKNGKFIHISSEAL